MSKNIVIVYHSGYGHTAKIAEHVAAVLRELGHDVEVHDVAGAPPLGGSRLRERQTQSSTAEKMETPRSPVKSRCSVSPQHLGVALRECACCGPDITYERAFGCTVRQNWPAVIIWRKVPCFVGDRPGGTSTPNQKFL